MTKDGRPSRINDIRYFHGDVHSYLEGHHEEVAFGRRLAWFLNGEGLSLGTYPALYIFFTQSIEPGATKVTDYGGDWWQRYTHFGVTADFPNTPESGKQIKRGTIAALTAVRPENKQTIENAAKIVQVHKDKLRFLLKTRSTKRFRTEISFNIAAGREPSSLFVSLTDLSSGDFLEAAPIPLRFYFDAFDLTGSIKITASTATLAPNHSVGAKLASLHHGGPLVRAISEFSLSERPVMSQLISRRG
ncbi:MAG TPA: hypothetical protein VIJ59_03250 [Caulobacteraceae bacterium]